MVSVLLTLGGFIAIVVAVATNQSFMLLVSGVLAAALGIGVFFASAYRHARREGAPVLRALGRAVTRSAARLIDFLS